MLLPPFVPVNFSLSFALWSPSHPHRRLMKRFLLLVLFAAAAGSPTALAQSEAASTVLNHFQARSAAFGLTAADLADVAVTDEYVSRHNGVTHVYLRQRVDGVEVFNARASAHVTPAGRVVGLHSTFVTEPGSRAASATPSLTAEAAVEAAAKHLGLTLEEVPSTLE